MPEVVDGRGQERDWPALARAICDRYTGAGADGLLIEVHPNPATALSDGGQQLTPKQFAALMAELRPIVAVMGKKLGS
jgi:3-deoxy-7-phosphoheptulonate synthase